MGSNSNGATPNVVDKAPQTNTQTPSPDVVEQSTTAPTENQDKAAEKAKQAAAPKVPEPKAMASVDGQAVPAEQKVPIRLPKSRGNSADVFVSVNGQRFQIQRGVTVMVPAYVAEILERSEAQDQKTMEMIEELVRKSQ